MPNLPLPVGAGDQEQIELLALFNPDDIPKAAALLRVPESEALAFIEKHDPELTAARLRLDQDGGDLEILAKRFAVRVLKRFEHDLDELDTMEAANLLKHALRIIENADRKELAKKEKDDLGVVHFQFVFKKHPPPGNPPPGVAVFRAPDVVDVEDAKEVR